MNGESKGIKVLLLYYIQFKIQIDTQLPQKKIYKWLYNKLLLTIDILSLFTYVISIFILKKNCMAIECVTSILVILGSTPSLLLRQWIFYTTNFHTKNNVAMFSVTSKKTIGTLIH